jgi:uncharacterized membrane protein (DUF441 family)
MNWQVGLMSLCGVLMLTACTSLPTGPSHLALPGTGKSFEQFRADDAVCRDYALAQVGGAGAQQAGDNARLKSAVVGTAVGAAAGAAAGGHEGAGVGAGVGLLVGTVAGSDTARQSSYGSQQQYDNAYTQLMYAKGQRVAVPADFVERSTPLQGARPRFSAVPPGYYPPPPPAGDER